MLAEMKTKLQAARLMTYRAAFLADQEEEGWMTEAAAAKLFVIPTAIEIAEMSRTDTRCLRIHPRIQNREAVPGGGGGDGNRHLAGNQPVAGGRSAAGALVHPYPIGD